ncbi:MAG: hypothetical protein IJP94_03930 [Clostridia bacterium]|nr:hypothetical protein [Clostridia bacterium]MBQ9599170.1 hypothetical protein [Clostridia bacterium]MBR0088973.1 hypothetical protein [Clostridia bacterium]
MPREPSPWQIQAVDEDTVLAELDRFDEIRGHKYPKIADNRNKVIVRLAVSGTCVCGYVVTVYGGAESLAAYITSV